MGIVCSFNGLICGIDSLLTSGIDPTKIKERGVEKMNLQELKEKYFNNPQVKETYDVLEPKVLVIRTISVCVKAERDSVNQ